jgi:tetratricopeptide (TPR) repeat protein
MKHLPGSRYLVLFLVLGIVGLLTYPLERRIWTRLEADQPSLKLKNLEEAMGQGILIGMFGGFRTLLADMLWLKGHSYWEKYDLPSTMTMINLATTVDPRPMFFWINGIRIIGLDMPVWRTREAGDYEDLPDSLIQRIQKEQAERAIQMIDRALEYHPDRAALYLEKGWFLLDRIKDLDAAAEQYLIGSKQPDAPPYAARIYAELLKRMGRKMDAYQYLRELYPTLSDDDYVDRKEVVKERIQELENELNIPMDQRLPEGK